MQTHHKSSSRFSLASIACKYKASNSPSAGCNEPTRSNYSFRLAFCYSLSVNYIIRRCFYYQVTLSFSRRRIRSGTDYNTRFLFFSRNSCR
jgi:hypothetical protein